MTKHSQSKETKKLLFITLEPIAERMAGPAIRCLELGRHLSDEFSVQIISPQGNSGNQIHTEESAANLSVRAGVSRNEVYKAAAEADILFLQANVLKPYPKLSEMGKYLVLDLYDPYLFTVLVEYAHLGQGGSASFRLMHQVLERHMKQSDFAVCASETQRDYWLGRYCALGRLNPEMYRFDPSLRKLVDVVPFGLPEEKAVHAKPAVKGVVPGIGKDDALMIWGGGIWEWFDPLTIIHAVDIAKHKIPNLRLYFMGVKSPNPQVAEMPMVSRARNLARELGLVDKHVFFGDSWVPYDERANYMLEADIGVSAHFDLPETRFSFRTRLLDYLWSGLPIMTTEGDELADLIDRHGAGRKMAYGNAQAWADTIVEIISDPDLKLNLHRGSEKLAKRFAWSSVVQPLRNYCRNPYHAPIYEKVTMPSLAERARAVYERGGKELVIKRSSEVLKELLK